MNCPNLLSWILALTLLCTSSTDEKFTSNWIDLQLPKAEALILNLTSNVYRLPDFMNTMNSLKVLIIINTGLIPTELKNLRILGNLPEKNSFRAHIHLFSWSHRYAFQEFDKGVIRYVQHSASYKQMPLTVIRNAAST